MQQVQQRQRRAIPLRNAFDVRRFLARLINQVRRGETEAGDAAKLAYLAGVLMKAIEMSEFEQRLTVLERNAGVLEAQRRELMK